MVQKYIIDKTDLPKLIRGKELALAQGSKYRAFCIEINEKLTNGDLIKAIFPNGKTVKTNGLEIGYRPAKPNDKWIIWFMQEWWNAPYKVGDTDGK